MDLKDAGIAAGTQQVACLTLSADGEMTGLQHCWLC